MGVSAEAYGACTKAPDICVGREVLIVGAEAAVAHLGFFMGADWPDAVSIFIIWMAACVWPLARVVRLVATGLLPGLCGFGLVCAGCTCECR